jgi:hypothetical protein
VLDDLDLDELRRVPRVAYYFRYRLHRSDFHELCAQNRLQGHYAAKPLHGRLTPRGRVDRTAPYNGDVAALFVPVEARTFDEVSLLLTHIAPQRIALASGRRNWPAIREAAEHGIREMLGLSSDSERLDRPGPRLR